MPYLLLNSSGVNSPRSTFAFAPSRFMVFVRSLLRQASVGVTGSPSVLGEGEILLPNRGCRINNMIRTLFLNNVQQKINIMFNIVIRPIKHRV